MLVPEAFGGLLAELNEEHLPYVVVGGSWKRSEAAGWARKCVSPRSKSG
jgi:hypothetical protein